jgi:type II secretory pathway pseudopilin PulG
MRAESRKRSAESHAVNGARPVAEPASVHPPSAILHPPFSRRSAFTLVDTLTAVGILAILAAVVVPSLQSTGAQTLESSAQVLAADLRLARTQAIGLNTYYTVRFDFANNSYELLHTGTGNPPPLVNMLAPPTATPGPYVVDLDLLGSTAQSAGRPKIAFAELSQSHATAAEVRFGPTGSTGPARTDDTVIWLTAGSGSQTRAICLTVSWVTGQTWIGTPQMLSSTP